MSNGHESVLAPPSMPTPSRIGPRSPHGPVTSNSAVSIMPLLTVSVTLGPISTAPANSRMPARMIALSSVSAPDPTDVPMAFATSFAPMPHAM